MLCSSGLSLDSYFASPSREQLGLGARGKRDVVLAVALADLGRVVVALEPLERVLANGLEHQQAGVGIGGVATHQQLLVEERFDHGEVCAGDLLGGVDRGTVGTKEFSAVFASVGRAAW